LKSIDPRKNDQLSIKSPACRFSAGIKGALSVRVPCKHYPKPLSKTKEKRKPFPASINKKICIGLLKIASSL